MWENHIYLLGQRPFETKIMLVLTPVFQRTFQLYGTSKPTLIMRVYIDINIQQLYSQLPT